MSNLSSLGSAITSSQARCLQMETYHQHNDVELGFRELGSCHGFLGGTRVEFPLRRLSLVWALVPHCSAQTSTDAMAWVVNLPLAWVLSRNLPGNFVSAILQGKPLCEPSPRREDSDRRAFEQWHEDFSSGSEAARHAAELELEARLRRLAADLSETSLLPASGVSAENYGLDERRDLHHAEALAAFIATHYAQPKLSTADIARAARIHERYAMTLFRRAYGVTMLQHLTQHRIWHAQRLLATTDLPISDVAQQTGFGSDSQFYACFKRHGAGSPKKYRAGLRESR